MAYTSQGTISVQFSGGETTLHFVPEQGYSNKHGRSSFAIFIRVGHNGNGVPNAVIRKYDPEGDGVEITVEEQALEEIAVMGASQKVKVEVQVVESGVDNPAGAAPVAAAVGPLPSLILTGIRMPA